MINFPSNKANRQAVFNLGRTFQPIPASRMYPQAVPRTYPCPAAMTNAGLTALRNLHLKPPIPPTPPRKFLNATRTHTAVHLNPPPTLPVLTRLNPAALFQQPLNPAQRSEEWFALRKDRLTTSTFSTALGFWSNRRSDLWREKIYSDDGAETVGGAARSAMNWGVVQEATAIERYKTITGRDVDALGFKTHDREEHRWLGASPDGLIVGCPGCPEGGILEVKCPFNKGKPELGLPWGAAPYYYMPQLQGLMEIVGREWVDLYCWTPNGSSTFRVYRDREYWEVMYGMLREFWWGSVVPAREALLVGKGEEEVRRYEPAPKHRNTRMVIAKSRRMAGEARLVCKDIGGHLEFYR